MSSDLQSIQLYGSGGPNPPKVAMILEELGLPYTVNPVARDKIKSAPYTDINPNGRLPSIIDPNNGNLTIWESGAIIEYLIDTYDKDHRLSFKTGTSEHWHTRQWLFFQTTGQAPYYGQAAWFKKFHHEQLPSALTRYCNEMARVSGVLEGWLAKQKEEHPSTDGPWLVGGRITYADIAFTQWQRVIGMIVTKEEYDMEKFPLVNAWVGKMLERDAVKSALEKCS